MELSQRHKAVLRCANLSKSPPNKSLQQTGHAIGVFQTMTPIPREPAAELGVWQKEEVWTMKNSTVELARISAAVLAITCLLPASATAQPDHYLHVLMVIDTHAANIGEGTEKSRDNMRASVLDPITKLGSINGYLGKVETLEGEAANEDRIRKYFRELPRWRKIYRGRPMGRWNDGDDMGGWDRGDTILFYYNGHGATVDGQHVLGLTHGAVKRSLIENEIAKLRPRLALIITDTCAVEIQVPKGRYGGVQAANLDAMRTLFLRGRGVVNINSCERGKKSYSFTQSVGAVFTYALAEEPPVAGEDVNWKTLIDKVEKTAAEMTENEKEPQDKVWRMKIDVR